MSILIKGIDMPPVDSDVIVRIWGTGYIQRIESYHSYDVPDGKATELLPHGDLIDRNVLAKDWRSSFFDGFFYDVIDEAPTVIEAEGING